MRSALAYRPGRDPLRSASAPAAIAFLGSFSIVAFLYPNPIVIGAAGVAAILIGLAAGVRVAVLSTLRWGAAVALLMVVVNGLVTDRGLTILARLGELPVLGQVNVTAESLGAGGVLGLRVLTTLLLFAVYSACVNPDEVLRLLRPIARRSALSATLVTRLVPVAADDLFRLREAAALRGPAAAPVGRAAMTRRVLAGSLDRAVDVAATLELRGYSLPAAAATSRRRRRSSYDRRFYAIGAVLVVTALAIRISGSGEYEPYPTTEIDTGVATLAVAASLPIAALLPFARRPGA